MKRAHFSRHSLSGKLLILFVIFAVLTILFVGGSMRYAFHDRYESKIKPHLEQYLLYVQQDIGLPPDRQKAKQLADKLNIEILIHDRTGNWSSHGRQLNMDQVHILHQHITDTNEYALVEIDDVDNFIMVKYKDTTLFFGIPDRIPDFSFKSILPLLILLIILLALYHVTKRLITPIKTIRTGVQRFGSGDLTHRINICSRDELGELASSFNSMADDIQNMLESKRQLLLAISHELRSPLTRTKVATELLDDKEQRERLHRDLNEIEKLIEELLETERLSSPHQTLKRVETTIQPLIQQVVKDFYPHENIKLDLPEQEIKLNIDTARTKLLLKNLLDNALQYNKPEQDVNVHLMEQQGQIEIIVQDSGEGIDADHLPHLTEPFYRVDPARQRETGGYGLGLYLCRMITEAHGGSIRVESDKNKGTKIRITLPMKTVNQN